ncbi:MAG: repeat containing protein [Herbinix sp.]|nr:repeat containing protein [Herbinix sp.]
MFLNRDHKNRLVACSQENNDSIRYINPNSIIIDAGYKIEAFAEGIDAPTSILFTDDGGLLIANSGYTSEKPSISRYVNGTFEVIADDFNTPLTGLNIRNGDLYISHKGTITVIRKNGTRQDIIQGLPSFGDYSNSRVAFGVDRKMYFGQGTATNSGVVGTDNLWVFDSPLFHDNPGYFILLNGQNFITKNMMLSVKEDTYTGAFSAYGEANLPFEKRKGIVKASGSILRANPDGSELELVAWGLRSPSYVKFDNGGRLFVSNNGFDIRGSRPIANAPDEFQLISENTWYGWPDYAGGEPVTSERFKPDGGVQPEFLLACHPGIPKRPFATFAPDSTIIGFDFNSYPRFGAVGDAYIAEFGNVTPKTYELAALQYPAVGHKISKLDMKTGSVSTFSINRSGFPTSITHEGGFGRPADITFGPDGAMYIVDMGISARDNLNVILPNTGVIWKVTRE